MNNDHINQKYTQKSTLEKSEIHEGNKRVSAAQISFKPQIGRCENEIREII